MQSASTEIPAKRSVALKIFDNWFHIIYKYRLKRKFTSKIKIFLDCFDARMITKFN